MSFYPNFAALLDQYLTTQERSGAWLAQRLRVNPATVTRWRQGDSRPATPEMVIRIADIFGLHGDTRQALLVAAGYGYLDRQGEEISIGSDGDSLLETVNETNAQAATDESEQGNQADAAEPAVQRDQMPIDSNSSTENVGLTKQRRLADFTAVIGWLQRNPWVTSIASLLLIVMGLVGGWFIFSQPVSQSKAAVKHFAIAEWKNLSPGASPSELIWLEDTPRIIYQKLSQVPALQGVTQRGPQLSAQERLALDLWIEGNYRQLDQVQLSADLYRGDGLFLGAVSVRGEMDDEVGTGTVCILDLQNQLAEAILAALEIPLESGLIEAMHAVPTHSCKALRLNNDATTLVMQNDFANAQILLEQAVAIDPGYADAYNNWGQLHYRQQQWAAAIQQYQHALTINAKIPAFYYNLALAQERLGNYTAAIQAYKAAIALEPLYPQALNNLGFTYLLMEQPEQALAPLQRGMSLAPTAPYLHKNLGRAYLAQGNSAAAIPELKEAIKLFAPDVYAEALYYLAIAYNETGDAEVACTTLADYLAVAELDDAERAHDAQTKSKEWTCTATPTQ